jgi:hypothetical protein
MTFIANCAAGGNQDCGTYKTLADAQKACAALPFDAVERDAKFTGTGACDGITFQYGHYQLRRSPTVTPARPDKPSTSWLITNSATCQQQYTPPPTPAPTPLAPDKSAYNHSKAAYMGLARTDPDAVWVYQT